MVLLCRMQAVNRATVPGVAAVLFMHLEQSLDKVEWVLHALKGCQGASGVVLPSCWQEQGGPSTAMPCNACLARSSWGWLWLLVH